MYGRRLTLRKTLAVVSLIMACVSMCRVLVLYLESISIIRSERASDAELLDLCTVGAARSSAKMRDACLRAQADRAAPVFFKAAMRALHTAWMEFAETCGSPFKLLLAGLFVLSVMAPPVLNWVRIVLGVMFGDDDEDNDGYEDEYNADGASHYILLDKGGGNASPLGFRRRVQRIMPKLLNRRMIAAAMDNERVREMEAQRTFPKQGGASTNGWQTLPLGCKLHSD